MRRAFLAVLLMSCGKAPSESPPMAWRTNVAEAEAEAARTGKPALVLVRADWDTATKELEHRSFADPEVRKLAQSYVLLAVDATDDEDPAFRRAAERFRSVGTPTLIFYAPHFRAELHRENQFVPPDRLASMLEYAGAPAGFGDLRARAWYEVHRALVERVRADILAHPLLEEDFLSRIVAQTPILGLEVRRFQPAQTSWGRVEPSRPEQARGTRNAEVGVRLDEQTTLGWGEYRTAHRGPGGRERGDQELRPGIEVAWRDGGDEITLVLLTDGFRRPPDWR